MAEMLLSLDEIAADFRASGKKYVAIFGPTASGKSDLGIHLAKMLDGEVINSDARQIYRGMVIGTGALTNSEQAGVPHYLLSSHEPAHPYDAVQFRSEAMQCANEILLRGKVPIFVGGTGLYLEALLGLIAENLPSDPIVRARFEQESQEIGVSALFEKLEDVDPTTAKRIPKENIRYIIRALEIHQLTGKPKSSFENDLKVNPDFAVYGLVWEREPLVTRINTRHAAMFQNGFLEEVAALSRENVLPEVWKTIGYLEARSVNQGTMTVDEAISKTQTSARQYAKRQMTWLRRMSQRYPVTLVDGAAIHQNVTAANRGPTQEQA